MIHDEIISEFGLCCPVDQSSEDKLLYGVLLFVAPEIGIMCLLSLLGNKKMRF